MRNEDRVGNEDLGLFADTDTMMEQTLPTRAIRDDEPDPRDPRPGRTPRRRRRRGRVTWLVLGAVMALVVGGVAYGGLRVMRMSDYEDYAGAGAEPEVVLEVNSGDLVSTVARRMHQKGIIASPRAYTEAAKENTRAAQAQPGFYRMMTGMSGAAAAARIVDPEARAGMFEIKGGMQLRDVTGPSNQVFPGILTNIAKAMCDEGKRDACPTGKDVMAAMEKADPAELGVPDWALESVRGLDPSRKLEGLIVPGIYHVDPKGTPVDALKALVTESAGKLRAYGFPGVGSGTGHSPYEVLMIASLVEREGIGKDFGKVARVTYNRLKDNMRLQYDSTVNYTLDKSVLLTTSADRERDNGYNTYCCTGKGKKTTVPPGPIASPSKEAIEAAIKPEPGDWLYFVKCDKDGTSCFAKTFEDHKKNKETAEKNGVFG